MTTKMKKRTRAEAKKLMWEYYRDNKDFLPKWIRVFREEIVTELRSGSCVDRVFRYFSEDVKSVGMQGRLRQRY